MENGRRWKRCSGKVGIRERRDGTRDATTRRRPEQRSFKELENVEKLLQGKGWDEQRFVVTYDIPQSVAYVLFSSTAVRPPNLNVRLLNNLVERRGERAWKIRLLFSSRFIVEPQPCYKFREKIQTLWRTPLNRQLVLVTTLILTVTRHTREECHEMRLRRHKYFSYDVLAFRVGQVCPSLRISSGQKPIKWNVKLQNLKQSW